MRKKDVLDRIALDIKRGGYHTKESATKKAQKYGIKAVVPSLSIRRRIPNLECIKISNTSFGNKKHKIVTKENTIIFVRQNLNEHYKFWSYLEKEHLNAEEEKRFIEILEKKGWKERTSWPPRQAEFHRFRIKGKIFTGWTEPTGPFWDLGSRATVHQEELPDSYQDWEEMVASILEVIQDRARGTAAKFNRKLEESRKGESFGFTRSTLACQDAVLHLPRLGG